MWIKSLAQAGYAARGLVYLIVGFFAVLAGFGAGEETGTEGALLQVLRQPFGTALLWLLIIGLIGHVIWRVVQAGFDADGHGRSARGLAVRFALLASAFTYATLTLYALSLMGVFSGAGNGMGSVAGTLERIVGARPVALGVGLVLASVAIAHWWKAATRKYADHFDAPAEMMAVLHPVSIIGLTARGFVFAVIAMLFFLRVERAEGGGTPPGLEEALEFVQSLPFGGPLLAALGVGLITFAIFSLCEARWRRIAAPSIG